MEPVTPEVSVARRPQIMVVDDEVAMVRSLELLLRPLGDIHKAYSVPEVEDFWKKNPKLDCVVTDVSMPEASGLDLLDQLRKAFPEIPVILMTAYSSVPQAVDAMHRGAFEYVVKPFENQDLVDTVKKALRRKGVVLGETKKMPAGWVATSAAMTNFLIKAEKAAQNMSPVLLVGEVGVGKSRAARWMHEISPRGKREFFPVDGRAHEEDCPLLERSFSKVGTVFVAEVFSLRPRLQDRLFELIKDEKLKVIASSSSSSEYQALPKFREDLYQALHSVELRFPSLKERKEDFEGLVSEILSSLSNRQKLKNLQIDASALKALAQYEYPGNVKELERILERAVLEAKAQTITEKDLHFSPPDLKGLMPFVVPVEEGWKKLEMLRESLERDLILRALEKYPDKSNTEIAEILGTTRRILELRINAYRIRES